MAMTSMGSVRQKNLEKMGDDGVYAWMNLRVIQNLLGDKDSIAQWELKSLLYAGLPRKAIYIS